jgi:hypothetical protein
MLNLALMSLMLSGAVVSPRDAQGVVRGAPEDAAATGSRVLVLVKVSSPQLGPSSSRVFPAHGITELQFDALFRQRLRGSHVLELKLYTPKGHLYQVLTVPFSGGPRAAGYRRLPGNPRVYVEQVLQPAGAAAYRVSARLPVAGTWIVTSSLYGSWRVDAHLDGAASPSGRNRFTIGP